MVKTCANLRVNPVQIFVDFSRLQKTMCKSHTFSHRFQLFSHPLFNNHSKESFIKFYPQFHRLYYYYYDIFKNNNKLKKG